MSNDFTFSDADHPANLVEPSQVGSVIYVTVNFIPKNTEDESVPNLPTILRTFLTLQQAQDWMNAVNPDPRNATGSPIQLAAKRARLLNLTDYRILEHFHLLIAASTTPPETDNDRPEQPAKSTDRLDITDNHPSDPGPAPRPGDRHIEPDQPRSDGPYPESSSDYSSTLQSLTAAIRQNRPSPEND